MEVFCLERFRIEYFKLIKKNSYKNLTEEIISYFFESPKDQLISGARLNQSKGSPYIKKRLKGRGGYRCYYLLVIKNEKVYLMFIHPKTGSMGASNINDEDKALIYKEVLQAMKDNNLFKVTVEEKELQFTKISS